MLYIFLCITFIHRCCIMYATLYMLYTLHVFLILKKWRYWSSKKDCIFLFKNNVKKTKICKWIFFPNRDKMLDFGLKILFISLDPHLHIKKVNLWCKLKPHGICMLGYSYQNVSLLTEGLRRMEECESSFPHGLLDWVHKWRTGATWMHSREALLALHISSASGE